MAKFLITRTSDYTYREEMEFNTLEELMDFVDKNGSIVIEGYIQEPLRVIEIYDTWRE